MASVHLSSLTIKLAGHEQWTHHSVCLPKSTACKEVTFPLRDFITEIPDEIRSSRAYSSNVLVTGRCKGLFWISNWRSGLLGVRNFLVEPLILVRKFWQFWGIYFSFNYKPNFYADRKDYFNVTAWAVHPGNDSGEVSGYLLSWKKNLS